MGCSSTKAASAAASPSAPTLVEDPAVRAAQAEGAEEKERGPVHGLAAQVEAEIERRAEGVGEVIDGQAEGAKEKVDAAAEAAKVGADHAGVKAKDAIESTKQALVKAVVGTADAVDGGVEVVRAAVVEVEGTMTPTSCCGYCR